MSKQSISRLANLARKCKENNVWGIMSLRATRIKALRNDSLQGMNESSMERIAHMCKHKDCSSETVSSFSWLCLWLPLLQLRLSHPWGRASLAFNSNVPLRSSEFVWFRNICTDFTSWTSLILQSQIQVSWIIMLTLKRFRLQTYRYGNIRSVSKNALAFVHDLVLPSWAQRPLWSLKLCFHAENYSWYTGKKS